MRNSVTIIIVSLFSLSHPLPKSGRRSDSLPRYTVQRKELKYSAPPRGRGGGAESHGENYFQPTSLHFIPTAPSVNSQPRSSITRSVQHDIVTTPRPPTTTTPPIIYSPVLDNTREQLNMSRIDQEDLVAEICKFSHHSLCDLFRPKGPVPPGKQKIDPGYLDLSQREKHPEPKTEEEKQRFKYRHNYPYRRQPKPGDYGLKRSSTTTAYVPATTESVRYHENLGYRPVPTEPPRYQKKFGYHPITTIQPRHQTSKGFEYHSATTQRPRFQEDAAHNPIQTESPPNIAGPFVTVQKETENATGLARQPKHAVDMFVDYGSDSSLNEVRVLPPEEFRHLLAQVDGIDRKDDFGYDSVPAESRRRPRQSKFRGVPGTAGRDFPTLGSIPMTSFSCIGTKAGFYADLETNCQVYHYCHFDGRQDSFLCANGTVFNQKVFTCDWWYNVNCAASEDLYTLNDNLYKDDSSLFGESVGGNGNDFDLSNLQSLLKKNTQEIDNLLSSSSKNSPLQSSLSLDSSLPLSLLRSSSKQENSFSKKSGPSGKSLKFNDLTSSRFLEPEVKSASSPLGKDDITVSYESRPSGGFSVFYTVPKEPLEASKVDRIKDLIKTINKKENLRNSVNDYEDDYYEDDEYESDYYADDTLTNIKTLNNPPDLDDDYYDPGPPASYYDDVPEYIDDEDDEYDDYDYDYDDDYDDDYYDVAEDRMMIESSTMNPIVLSPTIQQLNALTQKQLGSNYLQRLKKSRKKKKKSIDRSFDTKGQIERTPKKEENIQENVQEQTTKRSFSPNTHRSIQITPSSSIAIQSSNLNKNQDGFLGLFATVSDDQKLGKETTTAPLYLGNIDIEDLRRFQQFQEISGNANDLQKYMQLQNSGGVIKKEDKGSRKNKEPKLANSGKRHVEKQNRRISQGHSDDSEQKIEALQMLVSSNIQDSLQNQKQLYMNQRRSNSQSNTNQMSYVMPSGENLNIYKSQVEKPPQPPINNAQLQNGMPFLMQDPSQYKSQSILRNQPNPANVPYQSNTPNPINNIQSTLPFLDTPNIQNINRKIPQIQNFVQPHPYNLQSPSNPQLNDFIFKGNSQVMPNKANQNVLNYNLAPVNTQAYNLMGSQENTALSQVDSLNNMYPNNSPQPNPVPSTNVKSPYTNYGNEKSTFWETRSNPVQAPAYSNNLGNYETNSRLHENLQGMTAPSNDLRRVSQERTNYNLDNFSFNQQVNDKQSGYNNNNDNNNIFSMKDIDVQLRKAQEEQKLLQVQLNQLKNSGISPSMNMQKPQNSFSHFQNNKQSYNVENTPAPKTTANNAYQKELTSPVFQNSRNSYPRQMSGFPMNFEDMINTGLSLAKQKKENSYQNLNSPSINPRNKSPSMQMPWNSQQGNSNIVNYPSGSQFSNSQPSYSNSKQQKTNFNPSKLISQNMLEGKVSRERLTDNFLGNKDISSNLIDTDQIHIIGPNCYVMTQNGFKAIGKAPSCTPTSSSGLSQNKKKFKKSLGNSGSIWDSLTSIPLVNNFAKTIGI